MARALDLVVIGTGSAASAPATRCAREGWSVAIVDSRPYGGTCALRGCDPKKVLVGAAQVVDWVGRMEGKGVRGGAGIDWPALARFKRTFTDPVPERSEAAFREAGIETHHGPARMLGPTAVGIDGRALQARRVVIATGARPRPLGIPGEELVATSDDFLDLEELPAEIVFIGGGFIAFEFAHVAARAGARATIVHRGERPLEGFDPDLVGLLLDRTRAMGIEVVLGAEVDSVTRRDGRLIARAGGREHEADLVVHGAGRVPDLDDLDLEAAGIERDERGVAVNDWLQSVSNPAVYAAGDAASSGAPPLTPAAGYAGRVVARNLLEGNSTRAEFTGVASVVFTLPPLARVGLLEEEARAEGLAFDVRLDVTSEWYGSRRLGETASGYKLLIEKQTGRLLGAHLLGWEAEEVMNLFSLSMRAGVATPILREALLAYPSHGYDIRYMLG